MGEDFVPSHSENDRPYKRVAILGHSYVSRFYIDEPIYHPWFILKKICATRGQGGHDNKVGGLGGIPGSYFTVNILRSKTQKLSNLKGGKL